MAPIHLLLLLIVSRFACRLSAATTESILGPCDLLIEMYASRKCLTKTTAFDRAQIGCRLIRIARILDQMQLLLILSLIIRLRRMSAAPLSLYKLIQASLYHAIQLILANPSSTSTTRCTRHINIAQPRREPLRILTLLGLTASRQIIAGKRCFDSLICALDCHLVDVAGVSFVAVVHLLNKLQVGITVFLV